MYMNGTWTFIYVYQFRPFTEAGDVQHDEEDGPNTRHQRRAEVGHMLCKA